MFSNFRENVMVWWTCCEEYGMKQDEEGWTEKAAGLLGCRCVSSCGPGSPGQACQQREATWGGVQKSGGLGRGGACQEATRDCPTPPPHLLPEDWDRSPSVLCSWCLLRVAGASHDPRMQGPWPVCVLLLPRLSS